MKKQIICATLIMSILVSSASAQQFKVGLSAGVDASRMAISGASGGPLKYRSELAGGVHAEVALSSLVGLQLEVNYSQQGAGVINNDASSVGAYQQNYLTVPLLVKLYGTPKLNFFAGPQAGFLLDAKTKSTGQPDKDTKEDFKSTDFYAVFGAEYQFGNGVFISGRYNVGLSNVYDDETSPDSEIMNRYFCFRIGYSFKLGN